MADFAKIFISVGIILILLGGLLLLFGKIPGFGKLPGDILVKRENFTFYFPLTTTILISVIVSLILLLLNRR